MNESAKNNDTVWQNDILTLQKTNNKTEKLNVILDNEKNLLLPNSTFQYQFLW